jgi:hypothetical protein
MRLGVCTLVSLKGSLIYLSAEAIAYCRSLAEQILLKQIPLMNTWELFTLLPKRSEMPSIR